MKMVSLQQGICAIGFTTAQTATLNGSRRIFSTTSSRSAVWTMFRSMASTCLAMKLADIPCTERGNVAHAYLAGVRGMLARLAEERQKLCLEQAKGEGAREALSDVLVRLLRERAPVAEETGEDDDTL